MARAAASATERLRAPIETKAVDQVRDDDRTGRLDEEIATILSTFNATEGDVAWNVSVSRIVGANKLGFKEPWLFDMGVEELPTLKTVLRDKYNGGAFRARVYKSEGGKAGLAAQFSLDIEPPLSKPVASSDSPAPSSTLETMFASIMDRQEKMLGKILERVSVPATPAPASGLSAVKEIVEIMTSVKALQPSTDSSGGLAMFREGLSAARELAKVAGAGGGEGGEGGIMGLLGKLIDSPLLERVISAVPVMPAGPSHTPAPTMAPNGRPAALPHIAPGAAPAGPLDQLRPLVGYLIEKAQRGADPTLYADWLADNLTPEAGELLSQAPDLMVALATAFPEIEAHRPWFQVLVQALLTPEGDVEPSELPGGDTGRPAGHPRDAQAHAPEGANGEARPAGP